MLIVISTQTAFSQDPQICMCFLHIGGHFRYREGYKYALACLLNAATMQKHFHVGKPC